MRRTQMTAEARFMSKVIPEPNSGCWLYVGTGSGGYGSFSIGRARPNIRAHRYSYELLRGPIPEGLVLDHLCRTRCCVNPDHLEPVTDAVNIARGLGRKGHKKPQEMRQKVSAANKGRKPSLAARTAVAEANRRRVYSPETRRKLSAAAMKANFVRWGYVA